MLVCYLFESSWLMWSGRLFLVGYLLLFSGPCSVVQDFLTSRTFVYRIWAFILCLISVICRKVTAVHIPDISVIRAGTRSHIMYVCMYYCLRCFNLFQCCHKKKQISSDQQHISSGLPPCLNASHFKEQFVLTCT